MLPSIKYATLLQYSPRGNAELSQRSRQVRDSIKGGQIAPYKERFSEVLAQHRDILADFLNPEVSLVPTPRSSPLKKSTLWPAAEIAAMLASLQLGTLSTCLVRKTAVRKSALYPKADDRPSIDEHYRSFAITGLIPTQNITLVDDVLTLGRTFMAAASRLADAFPNAKIRAFALMHTKGRSIDGKIERILNVELGAISFNPQTGKCKHIQ
jgi:predicted amidophosphoribosyltransferase